MPTLPTDQGSPADVVPRAASGRGSWRDFVRFHQQPQFITLWCRWFRVGLNWLTPERRRLLLGLGALVIAVRHPLKELRDIAPWFGKPDALGAVLVLAFFAGYVALCYHAARSFSTLPKFIQRHPQIALHATFWLSLILLWATNPSNPTLRTVLAGCAAIIPFLLWRLGYMMFTAQRGKMQSTRIWDHLLYIWPVWG